MDEWHLCKEIAWSAPCHKPLCRQLEVRGFRKGLGGGTWSLLWDKDHRESCTGDDQALDQAYLCLYSNDNEFTSATPLVAVSLSPEWHPHQVSNQPQEIAFSSSILQLEGENDHLNKKSSAQQGY